MKEKTRDRDEKSPGKKLSRKEEKQLRRRETFTLWSSLSSGLYNGFRRILKSGPIGRFLTSYGSFEDAARSSFAATMPREMLKKRMEKKYRPKREIGTENIDGSLAIYNPATIRQPISRRFRQAVAKNKLLSRILRQLSEIPKAPISALGTFVFSLGVSSVLAQILRILFGAEITGIIGTLLCGFLLLLVSVPIISRNNVSLGHYVLASRIGYRILVPLLGLTEEWDFDQDEVKQPGWFNIISAIIGLFCGGITYLFPLTWVVLTVLAGILCLLTAYTPELGLNVILTLLPFVQLYSNGAMIFGGFVGFTAGCFLLNVLIGKRVMRFEAFDFAVLIFSAYMICSELFIPGDYSARETVLLILTCTLLYFLAKNLLRAEKWIECCMGCLIAASFLISVLGIAQAIITQSFAVTSVFGTPEQLAVYLLLTLFLTVGSFRFWHLRSLALILVLPTQFACLILTGSESAAAAFLLSFLLYLGISGKRMFSAILLTVFCLPLTLPFLPESWMDRIGDFLLWNDTGLAWRAQVWKNALAIGREGHFFGIGISGENFARRYSIIASGSPAPIADSAWGLYLDLLICAGVLGLMIFLAVMILFIRQTFTFYNHYSKSSPNVYHHQSVFCSLSAVLICGFLLSSWSSQSNLCLFWAMLGFAVAIKDSVVRERTFYQRELSPTEGEISIGTR